MAFTYHIDPAHHLATLVFSGTITGPELARAAASVYTDPDWRAGYGTLWDFRAISQLHLAPGDFQVLAGLDFARVTGPGPGRDALVVARPLDRTMARLFVHAARNAPRRCALFDGEAEARAWLGARRPAARFRMAA